MQVGKVTKGIWPKGNADRLRPALACVKKLLPGTLGQVLDGSFHYSILKWASTPQKVSCQLLCLHAILKLLAANQPLSQWYCWILMLCWAANRSNAHLASIVSDKLRLLVMR